MPPPTVLKRDEKDRRRTGERRSDIICKVKYSNTLPDIPFDPKFISYPFDASRFVRYNPTSLERSFKFDLLSEHDLGVPIDLINPDTYAINPSSYLEAEDERILEEDSTTAADTKRSRHHNKSVSWLRKTEYISTEYNRAVQKSDKAESRVGFNIKKLFNVEDLYKDRDSQLAAIEKTFVAAKLPVKSHPSKPGAKPVAELAVLPDFDLWQHPFAHVIFDSAPAPNTQVTSKEMSQAMIRGMVDESGEQFVAYFLPTRETVGKRKREVEDVDGLESNTDGESALPDTESGHYEYTMSREYNWNVKNKSSKGYEETYFLVTRGGSIYYNELDTRVRLSKRRRGGAGPAGAPTGQVPKTRLVVKHREVNEAERAAQEMRMTMLEPPADEEEEEEEDDAPAAAGNGEDKDNSDGGKKSESSSSSSESSSSSSEGEESDREEGKKESREAGEGKAPGTEKKKSKQNMVESESESERGSEGKGGKESSGGESGSEEEEKNTAAIFGSDSEDD